MSEFYRVAFVEPNDDAMIRRVGISVPVQALERTKKYLKKNFPNSRVTSKKKFLLEATTRTDIPRLVYTDDNRKQIAYITVKIKGMDKAGFIRRYSRLMVLVALDE